MHIAYPFLLQNQLTMKITYFALIFLVTNSILGQTIAGSVMNDIQSLQKGGMWIRNLGVEDPIEGNPYLFENWNNQARIYKDNKIYRIGYFNYNIAQERFEAKLSEDSVLVISIGGVNKIELNDVVLKPHYDVEFNKFSFFEELDRINDCIILKKYLIKIAQGSFNPMTKTRITSDKYVHEEHLYLLKDYKKPLERLKLKKSAILGLMDSQQKNKVTDFVKKHKLRYSKLPDVQRIFKFYNSLSS